uniref:Phosphoprotein n=1 Tax=Sambucus betanucleorhabdovirus 1 TaxID=3141829 RepID=A0AAU7E1G6_9RHAB
MNPSGKVHPRYSGLPDTAINSEVMAAKYAAEVSKLDNEEEKEYVLGAMEEWSTHFREEGLTVADKHLAVLGEMSLILQNAGRGDFTGKIAVMIADMLKCAISDGRAAAVSVEKLDLISDNFLRGIDKLMKVTESIASSIPRRQLKANRKTKSGPVLRPVNHQGAEYTPAEEGNLAKSTAETTIEMETGEPTPTEHPPPVQPPLQADKGKGAANEDKAQTHEQAEAMRAKVRTHYSDTEFESYTDKRKMALIYYYIENILGISKSIIHQDANLRQMLFDIVDKRRVIRVCHLARSGEFTTSDMSESIEEAYDAILACSNLYGNYACEIVTSGTVPVLVIIEVPA